MKKLIAAITTALVAVALVVVGAAAPASAHTASLTGAPVCNSDTGAATVTWTITNNWGLTSVVSASTNTAVVPTTPPTTFPVANATGATQKFTQTIASPAAGASVTLGITMTWSDGVAESYSKQVVVPTSCLAPYASAAIVDTVAVCGAAESVAEGAIKDATWGTLTYNGSNWTAVATATSGYKFTSAGTFGKLSAGNTVDTFKGTLAPASKPGDCETAAAAVVQVNPATCQGPQTFTEATPTHATWNGPITYSTTNGVTSYSATATAASGYEFSNGKTVLTLGGTVAGEVTGHPCEDYIIVAWKMPSWVNSTTPTWSQTYFTSQEEQTPDLSALDSKLAEECGVQYQVDIYYNSAITASLIAGEHLDGPNNPPEDLIDGGWGTAYKLVQGPSCATPVVPTETDTCNNGGSISLTAVDGVVYSINGTPVDTSAGNVVVTEKDGTYVVTAAAASGYALKDYTGSTSFTINTDCGANYKSTGDCTADGTNSQAPVSLTFTNPSSTEATFTVTSTDSTVTTSSFKVPRDTTEVEVVGTATSTGGHFSVTVNDGTPIVVTVPSFVGCILVSPGDPESTPTTCTGSTENFGTISTDGNPELIYTLVSGPGVTTPEVFPAPVAPATRSVITGLQAGDYVVDVTAEPGFELSGTPVYNPDVTVAGPTDCTGTPLTPTVTTTLPVCSSDESTGSPTTATTTEFTALDTEVKGSFGFKTDPNIDFYINGAMITSNPMVESDGTYTVTAQITDAAKVLGYTFAPSTDGSYTLNGDATIATYPEVQFSVGFCPPTDATWNSGATGTDATCTTGGDGTITLTHTPGQEGQVDYKLTNNTTHQTTDLGATATSVSVPHGSYTVTATPVTPGDGLSGNNGAVDHIDYPITIAAVSVICGSTLAFTGGTIAWFGFVLAGGMLFLGIAFLLMRRRGNRTAE